MTIRHAPLLLFLLLFASPDSTAEPASAGSAPQVLSYELDVAVHPEAQLDYAGLIEVLFGERPSWNKEDSVKAYPHLTGEAVMEVDLGPRPRDSLQIYLHSELKVHEAWIDGRRVEVDQVVVFHPRSYSLLATEATLSVDGGLSGTHQVELHYGGMFNASLSRSPSDYMRLDPKGAYLRAFGYSLWFPVLLGPDSPDQRSSFRRIRIRTADPFRAVVTGQRVSEETAEGRRVSEWRVTESDLSQLQLSVRPFEWTHQGDIHLYHLDDPRSKGAASDILELVRKLETFYVDHYGSATREGQVHIVELPNYASGISAGNTIGITSAQWRGFSSSDEDTSLERLIAHEMVHPYVRPRVPEDSPLAALFTEGFPSYFHLPALEEILGKRWYLGYLERVETSYLRKRETGETSWGASLPAEKPILEIAFEEIGTYKDTFILDDRVKLFLHDLRRRAGAERFKALTRELMRTPDLTPDGLMDLIERFIPECRDDLRIWLESVDYPEHLRLGAPAGG